MRKVRVRKERLDGESTVNTRNGETAIRNVRAPIIRKSVIVSLITAALYAILVSSIPVLISLALALGGFTIFCLLRRAEETQLGGLAQIAFDAAAILLLFEVFEFISTLICGVRR